MSRGTRLRLRGRRDGQWDGIAFHPVLHDAQRNRRSRRNAGRDLDIDLVESRGAGGQTCKLHPRAESAHQHEGLAYGHRQRRSGGGSAVGRRGRDGSEARRVNGAQPIE